MSNKKDTSLAESMGRRRPREAVRAEVADSVLAEMVPTSTVDLPVSSLFWSPFQVRETGNDDDIDRLAESIVSSGMISPIVVRGVSNLDAALRVAPPKTDDNAENLHCKFFEIVTGHHRVLAAIKLGWTEVPAVVKHMTDAQAAIALTADNAVKKDLTDWDRYQSLLMLEQTGACRTGREIARALGVSASQVSNLRAFGSLPEAAQGALKTSPDCCGYRLAYDIQTAGFNESHPDLVVEAIERLAGGRIKAQSLVLDWIRQRVASKSSGAAYRRELTVQSPRADKPIRIVATTGKTTILATGLNLDKLSLLIEQNLTLLTSP